MSIRNGWVNAALVVVLMLGVGGIASAERVRYLYTPADSADCTALEPVCAEKICWNGKAKDYPCPPPVPNKIVTFCHPHSKQQIEVPLSLPVGTPRIERTWHRIVYNYGSYTVEVRFLENGSYYVIYDSGLLRKS